MKVPAEAKLLGLAAFSVATVMAAGPHLLALAAMLALAALLLRASPARLLRMFAPALPFIAAIAGFQWLFAGAAEAWLSGARMTLLYTAGSLVTATTTQSEFVDAVETILRPASAITGSSVGRDLATMMALAIAFLPLIREEHASIRLAQEARGVSYAGLRGLVKGEAAVIVPLIYAISTRADRIATAMEARCYGYKR